MIHAHFVGMILKLLNIYLQHVLLLWLYGISLASTFIILHPKDLDLMYPIFFLEIVNYKWQ